MPFNEGCRDASERLEHAGYVELSDKWVSAKDLKKGDKVVLASADSLTGKPKYGIVVSVKTEHCEEFITYNFEVEDFHTYYVGKNGICTHNANCGSDALDWDSVVGKNGETRYEHVMKHATANPNKVNHTVFSGDPIATTNQAWASRAGISPLIDRGASIYNIPFANAGTLGENAIRIATIQGTNKLLSAYPVFLL